MAKKNTKKPAATPKNRPLIPRPGARFQCFNDGLCCTDIHALGPLTRAEAKDMRRIDPQSVFMNDDVEELCLKPVAGGGCFYQQNGLCQVHAKHGAEAKPTGCRRFPYGLVATPAGGRVTTEHRCPCRSLGERPPIDLQDAEQSLFDRAGRLEVDQDAPQRVPMTHEETVDFAEYEKIEARMLERLASGEDAFAVLNAKVMPDLCDSSWPVFAAEYFDMQDDTSGGEALAWFGDALLKLACGHVAPARKRPWAGSFEKGIARAGAEVDPAVIYNDWLADEIWMFRWYEHDVAFDVGRAEMATRLSIAHVLESRLREEAGLRADQAAAEAVMIVEVATVSTEWPKTVEAIANDPSPAGPLGS